jgi:TP901 family phage tail tape measure protein
MSTAGTIRAGKASVSIGADRTQLERGLRKAEARLKRFAGAANKIGQSFARLGVAVAAPFALSAKVFADFEQQMARVRAVTNNLTDEGFSKLEAKAKQLGATTAFSASQAATALGNFALAGFSVEEMLAAVGPALDLAAVGQIEIAESADIVAKVMRSMGIEAANVSRITDVMAQAMTTANTDVTMLGEAFKFVGPFAKTAGVELEEVTAAIQTLSDAGIQGEMAGTAMRGMLLGLTAPSGPAAAKLAELGVNVKDAKGNFRGFIPILADFQRSMRGMGSVDKLDALGTIFGARAASGAAVLIDKGGADLMEKTNALMGSTGKAAKVAAIQMDTLKGAVLIALSALEGLAIEIGEAVLPLARRLVTAFTELTGRIMRFTQENKLLVGSIAAAAVGLIAAGGALLAIGLAAKLAAIAVGTLAAVVGFLVSPLGIVVGLAVGAAAAFFTMSETGKQAFASLHKAATDALGGIADAFKAGDIKLAAKILWLSIRVEWQKGLAWTNGKTSGFIDSFINAFREISYAVSSVMIDVVSFFEKSFTRLIGMIKGFAAAAWAAVTGGDASAALAQMDQDIMGRVNEIEGRRQLTQDVLADQKEAGERGTRGVDVELQRLQAELSAALTEVAEKAAPKTGEAIAEEADKSGGKLTLPDLSGIIPSLERSEAKTDVKGSFSGAALRGFGAGDTAADRTADATERAADGIEDLNDRVRGGGLVFD